MRGEGYAVISCANARAAVAAVMGHRPDLVITDAHLEQAEAGLGLLAWLRADATTAHMGVIIFTADEVVLQCQRGLARRLQAALVGQPADLDLLLALIQNLVEQHAGRLSAAPS
ncbi:MAG: response regulator [Chloroflexales bacterium]|nr:response regulator [Chloroflexales bacterium]